MGVIRAKNQRLTGGIGMRARVWEEGCRITCPGLKSLLTGVVLTIGAWAFSETLGLAQVGAPPTTVAPDSVLAPVADAPPPPKFDGLGKLNRRISTHSAEAQEYFNQGLAFLYAFNHDEAIRAFRHVVQLDPQCAMGWWGIALAHGPHINFAVLPPLRAQAAWEALIKARECAASASEVEQALIAALGARYVAEPTDDRRPLDEAYAAAMRALWQRFPQDADVGALYAESLMDLRPWDLWTRDGAAQPGTNEVVATLEQVLQLDAQHPLALHLYIHAVEASLEPSRADDEADRLRELQPGLGHLVHMPSHIDVRRGRWAAAAEANRRAILADQRYRERSAGQSFYRIYMAHNHHMLAFALAMQGESAAAIEAIQQMVAAMPTEWVKENAAIADGFQAMPLEMLVRFGKWDEILAAPELPEYLPLSRALRHYARAVAHAAQHNVAAARDEQVLFLAAQQQLPPQSLFGNNAGADILGVAERLMAGEILYRAGHVDQGLLAMQEAAAREDLLRYNEPPDWIHPVRHAWGATLLAAERPGAAEAVYRADLAKLPHNGWSLFGLSRSLQLQGKSAEAADVHREFLDIWAHADFELTSSCLCQPGR